MRVKTEGKREAILQVAAEAFRERGFDATSMSHIAARLGGSKSTLYNYFSSKDEILLAVLIDGAETFSCEAVALLGTAPDFEIQLRRFVASLIKLLNAPELIQILRVAISVGGTSNVGRRFFERGTHDVWAKIAEMMAREIAKGALRDEDPDIMASHLRCLCEVGLIRNLMGACSTLSDEQIEQHADRTVNVFLRAYRSAECKNGRD
ncbi:TetR/AcrR family transcriptional regulator [Pusillimonas sp.]|uniref:TetR/AcrR family transcriptional regulator n=1 Tax=Pusillimonas sp. TaxID=3040095 RepID=UPI0029A40AFC|nr:TetR/AcrR family transcriptional regulator [Pusillimonas sp.]MDX3893123.1 TetR/AcrR family transcriptional regulator [Pusillimonas sp.]